MFVDRSSDSPRRLFIRLDPGEEVMASLAAACAQHRPHVGAGSITGIGAVRGAELGFYDAARGEYLRRDVPGDMELVAFVGNVTWVDGRPFVHAHAVLAGADFAPVAGHLFRAEITVTGEFFLVEGGAPLARAAATPGGLKLVVGR